jgi:hypothetical protein
MSAQISRSPESCNVMVEDIPISAITVGPRQRWVDESKVKAMADSIEQIGLQLPISVWSPNDGTFHLVAGLHRLRAAARLGWNSIPCFLVNMDENQRELWEVDENLCRSELRAFEFDRHLVRRKEIWEKMKAQESGAPGATFQPTGRGNTGFAAETAKRTGRSKATINRSIRRTTKIAPDVRESVKGTKLETARGLDGLARLEPEQQRKVVEAGGFPPPPAAPPPPASEVVKPSEAPPEDELELCLLALIQILRKGLSVSELGEAAYLASIIGDAITIADTFRAAAENDGE